MNRKPSRAQPTRVHPKPGQTAGLLRTLTLAGSLALCLLPGPVALAQSGRNEPVVLSFVDAEIEAVARTMASISGRNVVVDPRVKGTISLSTDRPVSPAAALNQFSAALRLQGSGQWVGGRLRFQGEAQAAPGREPALDNLLNILGRRQGPRSILNIG